MNLTARAVTRYTAGLALTMLFLFVPAGTFDWPHAWHLLILLFVPMLAIGAVLRFRAPALLRKRLDAKETEPAQKLIAVLAAIVSAAVFVTAGLNFRYGWCVFPGAAVMAGAVLFSLGWLLYAELLRENPFLSRTVRCEAGQKLVDTGFYARVRHPMYTAALMMFLAIPLVLNSPASLAVSFLYAPLFAARIKNEERFLEKELEGYAGYKRRVRFRLIPGIW